MLPTIITIAAAIAINLISTRYYISKSKINPKIKTYSVEVTFENAKDQDIKIAKIFKKEIEQTLKKYGLKKAEKNGDITLKYEMEKYGTEKIIDKDNELNCYITSIDTLTIKKKRIQRKENIQEHIKKSEEHDVEGNVQKLANKSIIEILNTYAKTDD